MSHQAGQGRDGFESIGLGTLLRVPYQALVARVAAGLAAAGFEDIGPAHLGIFQQIDHAGGTRLTDLAERLQITKPSAGYLVDYLEARGYLERVPDPADRRAKRVRMTERGWRLHAAAIEIVRAAEAEWAAVLGATELTQLRHLLTGLVGIVEQRRTPEPRRRPLRPGSFANRP